MALSTIQQIHSLVTEKKHILVTARKDGGSDAIAGAVALMDFFDSLGKRVDVVIDEFVLPEKLAFLKKARTFQSSFSHLQKFMISLDIKEHGLDELSYDIKDDKLRIYITPKHGALSKEQVSTAQTEYKYDLVITVDTPDLESLGRVFSDQRDLFFSLPIINIDHHAANEQYGQVNVIDTTAASVAEVLYELFSGLGEEHISKEVAMALLTAMIDTTRSFTSERVKPDTLRTASALMALGADRQYIIHNLYRTKTISSLKLWGEALTHLETHPALNLVSTRISRETFVQTGAKETDLDGIVDELIANSPEAKLILLTHEHPRGEDTIHTILYGAKGYDAKKLLKAFNPLGDDMRASISMRGKTVREVEEKIIQEIGYRLQS